MERWGNNLTVQQHKAFPLNSSQKKVAFSLNAQKKGDVVLLWLYLNDFKDEPPACRIEVVKAESPFRPKGEVVGEAIFTPVERGWQQVDLNVHLEKNGAYFIVVSSPAATEEKFFSLGINQTLNSGRFNLFISEKEGVWRRKKNLQPIFLVELLDGSYIGQTYLKSFSSLPVYGKNEIAEIVTIPEPKTVSQVAFRVKRSAAARPLGDLYFALQEARTGEVIEEGVLAQAGKVFDKFAWFKHRFKEPHTLKIHARYRLVLKAPQATSHSFYEVEGVEAISDPRFIEGTFLGSEAAYAYPEPTELAGWKEEPHCDLCFYFTSVPLPIVAVPISAEAARRRKIIAILILLLLMLQFITLIYLIFFRLTPEEREFLRRNRECLLCHTEMLPKFRQYLVHDPFFKKDCLSCHLPHAERLYKEKKVTYVETKGKKFLRRACGEVFRIKPESPCGRLIGISEVSATRRARTVSSKLVDNYHEIGKAGLRMAQKELCLTCHQALLPQVEMEFQHNPFERGLCTGCHDPHAADYINLLLAEEADLCVSCHRLRSDFALPILHRPFKERACVSCHHPHASDYAGILQDNQKVICFACHPKTAREIKRPVRHDPFDRGTCTQCHRPHSSRVDVLLEEQLPFLCYGCHPTIRLDFLKASHHPVDVTWTCLKCHGPHATNYLKLVIAKDNELCFLCHSSRITDFSNRSTYENSAHGKLAERVGVGLCLNCHTPHGSDYPPLEVMREEALCYLCHDKYVYGRTYTSKTHPVWDAYVDERLGWARQVRYGARHGLEYSYIVIANPGKPKKTLRCVSTCHDPHGTKYFEMLRWVYDALCLNCHQIPELH